MGNRGPVRLRLLSLAAGLVLLVAAAELASVLFIYAATGKVFSYRRIPQEQAEVVATAVGAVIARPETPAPAPPPTERTIVAVNAGGPFGIMTVSGPWNGPQ